MELNILFLNVLKYKDKETNADKFRVSYVLNDNSARQSTANMKGLSELCFYTDNPIIFAKFTGDDALKPMTLIVEQKPSLANPLKMVSQVTAIRTKNDNISLL